MPDTKETAICPLAALKIRLFIALGDKQQLTEIDHDLLETLSFDPDVAVWAMEHVEAMIDAE